MVQTLRPAFLTLALLMGAAPAFAQGVGSGTPAPASNGTQRPVAAAPATPSNPAGQVTQRPAIQGQATPGLATSGLATPGLATPGLPSTGTTQAPARPAQPAGTAATIPAPSAPRTN